MWSLTSQRERCISGPENFQSSAKKDFFNTTGAKRKLAKLLTSTFQVETLVSQQTLQAILGKYELILCFGSEY
jgi:hypothetical protein